MTDTTKKALIALLGIAIVFLAYMYIIKPAKEDTDALQSDCDTLQTRLDDLIAKEAQKDRLLAETEQFNKMFEDELKKYPADLNQETAVMFLKSIEEKEASEGQQFINKTFTLPPEAEFYTLGAQQQDGQIDTTTTNDALTGEDTGKDAYRCYTTAYSISYKGTYEGIKDVLKYVSEYKYRMNVSSLSIAHDITNDEYTGSIAINGYAVSGPGRTPESVDPGVPKGTDNIFVAGDGSGGASPAASKYDADQGASIVGKNDLSILLNPANADISAGIIVTTNASRDETYVTSSDNARAALEISVYSQDGKNFIEYSIGDKKYASEILSEDVKIYVKSSARTNTDDANGVDVSVKNTTTLPVYFKVVDDDATSPRFKLVGKSGVVKTYQ